jgi:hypothetical protein
VHPSPSRLAAALLACTLLLPSAAVAHRPYYRSYLIDEGGTRNLAYLEVKPTAQGRVKLYLSESLPGNGTGTLVVEAMLNRVALAPLTFSIDSAKGIWPLGLPTNNQDKLEILDVRILDETGTRWAKWGSVGPPPNKNLRGKYLFVSALTYVMDTASDVAFTRGGDTTLLPNGFWTIGFDALRSRSTGDHLNAQGLYGEIDFSRNGGPVETHSVSFDVRSGKSQPSGRPGLHFDFAPGDVVEVKRVEIFDGAGNLFAKVGIRMGAQGHYVERHALDTTIPLATGEHAH